MSITSEHRLGEHGPAGSEPLTYSPTLIQLFADCPRHFWFQRHPDGHAVLDTPHTAAAVSSAIHDALMALHRRLDPIKSSPPSEAIDMLRDSLRTNLRRHRLDPEWPDVHDRLKKAASGLDVCATLVAGELGSWALDPRSGERLCWAEPRLDHGPRQPAVDLGEGFICSTRPDLLGMRQATDGAVHLVIRDYKVRNAAVDPAWDVAMSARALWTLREASAPRCRWFLANRNIEVDQTFVVLESVNLLHAESDAFVVRRSVDTHELTTAREWIVDAMRSMVDTETQPNTRLVPACPSPFCVHYCESLLRCREGRAYVTKYHGSSVLESRLK